MDQDAFRKLLSTSKQNGSQNTPSRGSWLSKAKEDQKKAAATSAETSKPAFKPRKVKKHSDSGYRDRAAERRTGVAGDFAEVESVLETFEKQHANEDKDIVEERRKYLGGDSEHTILVKGLDFALLEQAKARLAASSSAKDDEELEEALRGVTSASPPPLEGTSSLKKRTREDIVRELKDKRTKGEVNGDSAAGPITDKTIEEAKREGKFRPIGFKPIGSSSTKGKEDGKEVKKKKKRKVEESVAGRTTKAPSAEGAPKKEDESGNSNGARNKPPQPAPAPQPEREPEPLNEDFDIFADAGEYEGINLGGNSSDSDEDDRPAEREDGPSDSPSNASPKQEAVGGKKDAPEQSEPRPKRKWIEDEEDRDLNKSPSAPPPDRHSPSHISKGKQKDISTPHADESSSEHDAEPEPEPEPEPRITCLAPLASSAVPSIRDILAADSALEAEQKRRARKEKQKNKRGGGGGDAGEGTEKKVSAEAKINRDYQKLKSYTEKKGGGGL